MTSARHKLPSPKVLLSLIGFFALLAFTGMFLLAGWFFSGGSGRIGPFDPSGGDGQASEAGQLPFSVDEFDDLPGWDGKSRVTVLVMGLDYNDWRAGQGPPRTDSMMLLTVDPVNKTAGMLSIPRDLWVSIPGYESDRINKAYFTGEAFQLPGGGPALAVRTVEKLLGVPIHYYVVLDFDSFVYFVDEIGGVKLDVPETIKVDVADDTKGAITIKPGRQTLTGELTLAYARARYTQGGDFDRAARQQQVILGIRERLLTSQALRTIIVKAPDLYARFSSSIRTNLTLEEIIRLAVLAQQIDLTNINQGIISTSDVLLATTEDNQNVLIPLPDKIRALRNRLFASTGVLSPLASGSLLEIMQAENPSVVLIDTAGQASALENARAFLGEQGLAVQASSGGDFTYLTTITDFTGNPHTIQYFVRALNIPPENVLFSYNPDSAIDIQINLGTGWAFNPNP
jgi:LCP family protein required for cell wall assembly